MNVSVTRKNTPNGLPWGWIVVAIVVSLLIGNMAQSRGERQKADIIAALTATAPAIEPTTIPDETNPNHPYRKQLFISTLEQSWPIRKIPIRDNTWALYSQSIDHVGQMEGFAEEPGLGLPVMIAGHSVEGLQAPMNFSRIRTELEVGDEILYRVGPNEYGYKVVEITELDPTDVDSLFRGGDMLGLLTCSQYDPETGLFNKRAVVWAKQYLAQPRTDL